MFRNAFNEQENAKFSPTAKKFKFQSCKKALEVLDWFLIRYEHKAHMTWITAEKSGASQDCTFYNEVLKE